MTPWNIDISVLYMNPAATQLSLWEASCIFIPGAHVLAVTAPYQTHLWSKELPKQWRAFNLCIHIIVRSHQKRWKKEMSIYQKRGTQLINTSTISLIGLWFQSHFPLWQKADVLMTCALWSCRSLTGLKMVFLCKAAMVFPSKATSQPEAINNIQQVLYNMQCLTVDNINGLSSFAWVKWFKPWQVPESAKSFYAKRYCTKGTAVRAL